MKVPASWCEVELADLQKWGRPSASPTTTSTITSS
jgi:hypothetical protein